MAYEVVETWKCIADENHRYHFTKNNCVVRNDGKFLFINNKGVLNFSGMGQRATVADFRKKFNNMLGWIKQ